MDVSVRQADALRDDLPAADVAIVNVAHEIVAAVARQKRWPGLVASGYLVSEPPVLEGYRHVERAEEAGWAADLFDR